VVALADMDHLMHQNVFEACERLLCQLEIQPDAPRDLVAAARARFHFLYAHLGHIDTGLHLPFGEQRWKLLAQSLTVPAL